MKIKSIKFNNHSFLGDLEMNFCDNIGKPVDTVVIIGENGTGKTTILKNIYKMIEEFSTKKDNKNIIYMEINKGDESFFYGNQVDLFYLDVNKLVEAQKERKVGNFIFDELNYISTAMPKIIYMPTEINFNNLHKVDYRFRVKEQFLNVVDQDFIRDIPSLIANRIQSEIFKNDELPVKESIKKVCEEINSIFGSMELEVKLVGVSKDDDNTPIFQDKSGNQFNIEELSSGEKQLFLRAVSLKFLEANNSIILIDEPEISLHPEWQRKIIKVYENIGESNQLIIATHSPLVVGDIKLEQLRILQREKNKVTVVDNDKLNEIYGQPIDNILRTIMKLDSVRNEDIAGKLKEANELLNRDMYDTEEFKTVFEYLRKYLGDLDKDIMLMNLEISRRKGVKKKDAKGK